MALIICPECNKDISDKVEACPHCGYPFKVLEQKTSIVKKKKNIKLIMIGVPIVILAIMFFVILSIYNRPINKFVRALNSKNVIEVKSIYEKEINNAGNIARMDEYIKAELDNVFNDFNIFKTDYDNAIIQINTISEMKLANKEVNVIISKIEDLHKERLVEKLNSIYNQFVANNITYENACNQIDEIKEDGFVAVNSKDTKKMIDELNNSRNFYNKALNYLNSKDYVNALKLFGKVIKEDKNYDTAREKVTENSQLYKNDIIKEIEVLKETMDYSQIVSIIAEGLTILKDDSELSTLKRNYQDLLEEQQIKNKQAEIEELKNNQEMVVTNVKVDGVGFLNSNKVYVTVKNNSDKVVKEYIIGMLCFDRDGYPVTPNYNSDNIEYARATYNIQPNKSYGQNSYTTISSANKLYVKACVVSVEYHDGAMWENQYFDYWLKENKDKY